MVKLGLSLYLWEVSVHFRLNSLCHSRTKCVSGGWPGDLAEACLAGAAGLALRKKEVGDDGLETLC